MRVAVVGGAGHIGLPLSLLLADRGFSVDILDSTACVISFCECAKGRGCVCVCVCVCVGMGQQALDYPSNWGLALRFRCRLELRVALRPKSLAVCGRG